MVLLELKEILEKYTKNDSISLVAFFDKKKEIWCPYKLSTFDNHFIQARKGAGISGDLQFRDLRRTAATLLAEAGCTPSEITAVTGPSTSSTNKMVDTYVGNSNVVSDNAMEKRRKFKVKSKMSPK